MVLRPETQRGIHVLERRRKIDKIIKERERDTHTRKEREKEKERSLKRCNCL